MAVAVGLLGIGAAGWAVSRPDLPDFTRTHTYPLPGGRTGWATDVEGKFQAGAVGGGRLFVCNEGSVAAFDQATGRRDWQIGTVDIDSSDDWEAGCWWGADHYDVLQPVGDRLVYNTESDHLIAVDAATGVKRWMRQRVYPAWWTVSGTTVYALSDQTLTAVNAETGAAQWSVPVPVSQQTGADVLGACAGTVAVFTAEKLYGYSTADGHLLWSRQLVGATPATNSPPIGNSLHITGWVDGTRMIVEYAGVGSGLVVVDLLSGQLVPTAAADQYVSEFFALGDGRVLMWSESGPSQILDPRSGAATVIQLADLFDPVSDGTRLYSSTLVGSGEDSVLSATDPTTGTILWRRTSHQLADWEVPLAAANGVVYLNRDGVVYTLDAATGTGAQNQPTI